MGAPKTSWTVYWEGRRTLNMDCSHSAKTTHSHGPNRYSTHVVLLTGLHSPTSDTFTRLVQSTGENHIARLVEARCTTDGAVVRFAEPTSA